MLSPEADKKNAQRQLDRQLAVRARTEILKRQVDMALLNIFVEQGNVEIRGKVVFMGVPPSADTDYAQRLAMLDRAVRGLSGVKTMNWRLEDWVREFSQWRRKQKKSEAKIAQRPQPSMDGLTPDALGDGLLSPRSNPSF